MYRFTSSTALLRPLSTKVSRHVLNNNSYLTSKLLVTVSSQLHYKSLGLIICTTTSLKYLSTSFVSREGSRPRNSTGHKGICCLYAKGKFLIQSASASRNSSEMCSMVRLPQHLPQRGVKHQLKGMNEYHMYMPYSEGAK